MVITKHFKEGFAIIQILNGESMVKALIEVAKSVHPTLEKVEVSKLIQCFLYSDYLFRLNQDQERRQESFYTVLTDAYSWHMAQHFYLLFIIVPAGPVSLTSLY